ncbi:DUF4430 domain-containing protein, partial [Chloroflexota bacterium]
YVRVEGKDATIWSGNVTVTESDITADNSGTPYHLSQPTALGALDEASNHEARFPYYVTDEYGSPYVSSINGEEPEGVNGWLYRVDYTMPSVGAGDFVLDETNQQVLWYYGGWAASPLKISIDKTALWVGEEFIVTVTEYSDGTAEWLPCASAIVHADQDYMTGDSGTAAISIDQEVSLNIFAEKEDFVRSDKVTVAVSILAGDATSGGSVDANDITKVERIIVGLDAPTPGADANQDGKIDACDITKVERIIAGVN